MLATHTPFPHAGSMALYGDRPVRIQRVEADGRRFITAPGRPTLAKKVELTDLSDAAAPADPVRTWLDERIDVGEPTAFMALYDDFVRFCRLRGMETLDIPATLPFGRRVFVLTGAAAQRRRPSGGIEATRCLPLTLRTLAIAA